MTTELFDLPRPSLAIAGSGLRFPVHRIYCVGRNYAEHVREMGQATGLAPPVFFQKPADAATQGQDIPYPPATGNLHHEVELVVVLGRGAASVSAAEAPHLIFGYAVGNDLTRRDLQAAAKASGAPWDAAKAFDASAPIGAIHRVESIGHPDRGRIWLAVNGAVRQDACLSQMLLPVAAVLCELSRLFRLQAGDLVYTGTPAGVGPLLVGDRVEAGIDGVGTLSHRIVAPI